MFKRILKKGIPVLFFAVLVLFLVKWSQIEKVPLISDQSQEFEKAIVTQIITDNLQEDGSRVGNQEVKLRFLTGKRKGEEIEAVSTNGNLYGAICHVGTKVITLTNQAGDTMITSVYSIDRGPIVICFCAPFLFASIRSRRKKRIKSNTWTNCSLLPHPVFPISCCLPGNAPYFSFHNYRCSDYSNYLVYPVRLSCKNIIRYSWNHIRSGHFRNYCMGIRKNRAHIRL